MTALFVLFSFAEALRYGLAFYGLDHFVTQSFVLLSDGLLTVSFWTALVGALAAEGALTWWLWSEREQAYPANRRSDPRRWWEVVLLSLAPVVNLVAVGVLLKELLVQQLERGRRDWQLMLRTWWAWWFAAHLAVIGLWCWHQDSSVQARADGLLLSTLTGLVLARLTWQARHLVLAVEDSRKSQNSEDEKRPARLVVAV